MERTRILELALQSLQQQKAGIETEIKALIAELGGREPVAAADTGATDTGKRRQKTPAEKAAQARKMREIWAARKKMKSSARPAATHAAAKGRVKTEAEKKALSLKMKEAWKKRKAAAAANA